MSIFFPKPRYSLAGAVTTLLPFAGTELVKKIVIIVMIMIIIIRS